MAISVFRPALEIMGTKTRFPADRIRTIDVDYVHGDPIDYLDREEMMEVEHAIAHYLRL